MNELFRRFAKKISEIVGSARTFSMAIIAICVWALSGPLFNFSDTWQLVINTSTTIVTFLIVFLIQNTQNRDTRQLNLKLDELIRANKQAQNRYIDLEKFSDAELDTLEKDFIRISHKRNRPHHLADGPGPKAVLQTH